MVSAEQKQQQQQQASVSKSPKQADAPLSTPKAENFIKPDQMSRPAEDVMRLRALLNTKESRETNTKQGQASKDSKTSQQGANRQSKHHNKHNHHHVGGESVEHEQRDRIAFRYVGSPTANQNRQLAANAKSKDGLSRPVGMPEEEMGQGLGDKQREAMQAPNSSTDSSHGYPAGSQPHENAKNEDRTASAVGGLASTSANQADRSVEVKQEAVKLLDLAGPEAVMTLKERLREVWVNLDNTPDTALDVIARMPASVHGLNNSELLTVESPQGVHFVAFLKNRNDFEVLQTFDRHALLPGEPTKQLMEAAVMAYEQLGTVCKEGAERIEGRVKKLGNQQHIDQVVFDGLRKQWVGAKRRSKKCGDLVDELLERIDEAEAAEKLAEKQEGGNPDTERTIKPENERPVLEVPDDGE